MLQNCQALLYTKLNYSVVATLWSLAALDKVNSLQRQPHVARCHTKQPPVLQTSPSYHQCLQTPTPDLSQEVSQGSMSSSRRLQQSAVGKSQRKRNARSPFHPHCMSNAVV